MCSRVCKHDKLINALLIWLRAPDTQEVNRSSIRSPWKRQANRARRCSPVGVSGWMGVHVTRVSVRTTSWLFFPIWKIPLTIGSSGLYFFSVRPLPASSVHNWGSETERFSVCCCCFRFFFFALTRFLVPRGDTGCVSRNSSWLSDHALMTFVELHGDSSIT